MKALLIVAIVLQAIGILFKVMGVVSLVKDDSEDANSFGIYSTYSILFSIFFEVVLILSLVNLR